MAEVRKHKESTDAISAAIRAAMGDPVKPKEPGSQAVAADGDESSTPTSIRPTLASTSFTGARFMTPKKKQD